MNSTELVYTREAVMKMLKMIKRGNIDPEILQRQLAMERISSEDPSNLSGNSDLDDSLLISYSMEDQVLLLCCAKLWLLQFKTGPDHFFMQRRVRNCIVA